MAGQGSGQHGGVTVGGQQAEPPARAQHRGDTGQRLGRVVHDLEHAVAQQQVSAAGRDEPGELGQVALHPDHPVLHTPLGRAPCEGGQGVGAGVDDGDAVAGLSKRDREASGATAGVDDVEAAAVGVGLSQRC